ncbi:hypothetical protein AB9P05_02505 [Roseivirga sp. BDSF3-8]|uniref:hypothetical protein n=1 Tax=Roseivirga sp. BDSF3-8 TaxID=3241598 RepID=UPI00353244B4
MKPYYLPLLLILLSACYATSPRPSDPNLLDATLPVKPHDGPVEVIFPGEPRPEKAYRKVALVETHGDVPARRVDKLKEQARRYGADAIIILTSTSEPVLTNDEGIYESLSEALTGNEIPDNWYVSNVPFMQALAIVYEESLAPERFNQFAEVRIYDEENGKYGSNVLKTVEYNYRGHIKNEYVTDSAVALGAESLYPQRTNPDFLINGTKDWVETAIHYEGEYRVLERRQEDNTGRWQRYVKVYFNSNRQPMRLELTERDLYPGQRAKSLELFPTYNQEDLLTKLVVFETVHGKRSPVYAEEYRYDKDRLIQQEVFKIKDGEKFPRLLIDFKAFPEDYDTNEAHNQ